MSELIVELFDTAKNYFLNDFDCGEEGLNDFLVMHLARQHDRKILRGYILRTPAPAPKVLGYYTLSGSCFEKVSLPSKSQQKKVPYRNVPSITLGRLAVDKTLQGQGWGAALVAHAMKVILGASQAVGIHGMFVEALNENASAFYLSLGFIPLAGENAHALFYPTKAIEQLFAKAPE
ncbi:acetyltransferase [Klebsiella sp. RIT-PI-d]|uniref:GNAT family N-acetyltransferase n=1 Tax=Klebsiella sp. RIT-PI-d TaxID=1681196 RepID=UPI0006769780|nr:GNAT family N-acetyltransferase [Klebsiella sp. RIT-PI-d]KNC11085.1 acetyltransferase [Klebsiella sp. RIT-PI-d]